MRILIITDNLMKGGKERRLTELLRYLDNKNNIKVRLIILKNLVDYPQVFKLKNTEIKILPRKIKKDPTVLLKIWKISKDFKPDIFHSWGSMPSVYIFLIAFFMRKPFLNAMIANAICKKFSKNWIRSKLTFPFSKIILSNSYAGLKAFKVNKKKGRVIYNGFNMDRLKSLKTANQIKELYSISTPFVIGMVGAFHERKDYKTYLKVANEVSQSNNDITFLAIGDGRYLQHYKKKYAKNKKIVFTGNVLDVESIINIIDIGVLLTNPLVHQEGISNALLEFMAQGKPIIASVGGGTDELIYDGTNGILVNPRSAKDFKIKLLELLNNQELKIAIGNNAKEDVNKRFSIESMSLQTIELYKELLN